MLASHTGNKTIAKLLFENGAQVDVMDNEGTTCLMLAVISGHLGMVKYLYEKGCQLEAFDQVNLHLTLIYFSLFYIFVLKHLFLGWYDMFILGNKLSSCRYYQIFII